ncbi:hypothetical protein EDD21DRAFT_418973 [Dissophora ornata]|nr:hypothetical protein BGZ58_011149 [Dissophora ornata]KAI8597166.1 hypothetical protein EDD21DRAFT_418973 [Dissophora ornata]
MDTTYLNAEKSNLYSYKLRKSGFRTQHPEGILASSEQLTSSDFSRPVRKRKDVKLTDEDNRYDAMFGNFRSKIESYSGGMQTILTKFSNTEYQTGIHHSFWLQEQFDYPDCNAVAFLSQKPGPSYRVKSNDARSIYRLQDAFLSLALTAADADQEMVDDNESVYESDRILGHHGEGESLEYRVLWKDYDANAATWEQHSNFV